LSFVQRARAAAGFTLLEIMVVFVIVALATSLAVPAWRRWFEEDDMTLATRRIEALFRLARDSAIRSGSPVTVVIDSISGTVWLDAPKPTAIADSAYAPAPSMSSASGLPAETGTSLELPGSVKLELAQARARFEFAPSGAAFADSLVLRTPLAARLITVHPWTGDVQAR
jgi:prepilin-type N-terminal cleavage/methylation domain-containing protein